jgi:nitroimidazol reductase NimA-like FMN-containing flavoprotein (pyridoxamine 5'-phosphate oxidase superfamily)
MWVREGRIVVFRNPASRHYKYNGGGPKVGLVISETDDGVLTIRTAVGNRRYCAMPIQVSKDLVAREATAREAVLGHPIGPVPAARAEAVK